MAKGKYEHWLTPDGLLKLEAWARDGLTDEQISYNIGITAKTLYEWKKQYSKICEALKRGKEVVDIEVENALLNNALGYDYNDQVVSVKRVVEYENGKRVKEISEPVVITLKKHKPAETAAQIFWLKNRKPDRWRDKQDINHTGGIDIGKRYADMPDEELEELVKKYEKINSSKD